MSSFGLNLIRLLLVASLLAVGAVGTASATGESPDSAGPNLQGENLLAPFTGLTVTSDCNEDGISTVEYHAEGAATGPFPGTFVADGRIEIDPQTAPARPPMVGSEGTFMGPVASLTERFTIFSGDTTISGSKTRTEPLAELGERERGTCQNLTLFGGVAGTGRIVEVEAATTYEATIESPLGTFTDSGRSTPVLTLVEITGECAGGVPCESRSGNFDQLFTRSDQVAPPPPSPPPCDEDEQGNGNEDGDDQGCEDDGDQDGNG